MIRLLPGKRFGPIGVDIGSRCIKLVQFSADGTRLIDAARRDIPQSALGNNVTGEKRLKVLATELRRAWEGRSFRGRDAVVCLGEDQLFLQNIRVPRADGPELDRMVQQEAVSRIPYAVAEAEIRYIHAADVRQGDTTLREVILMVCHRPSLERSLDSFEDAGFRPVAVDVEPNALQRCYVSQFRRDEDKRRRTMYVHVGHSRTAVVIAQDEDVLFVKYVALGGKHMDEGVARHLGMEPHHATALRRTNGDRRTDQQDPEVSRSVAEGIRPVIEQVISELSMCIRYHSVTFRGQPVARLVLGGGEACVELLEAIEPRFDMECELSDPFRQYHAALPRGRKGMWDVAAGLALREIILP